MSSTITVDVHGESVVVDLGLVSALDALTFRIETGTELDDLVGRWLSHPEDVYLADHGVLMWLRARQKGHPLVSLAGVLASVPLLPPPADEAPD